MVPLMNIPNQRVPKLQPDQTAIDYTISRDFAAGVMAEQEKNLQGFLDNGEVELLAAEKGAGAAKKHALQDYQMQLMLLEQQDKKRRLLAREESTRSRSQYLATKRKRSRVDTQAEQSRKKSTKRKRSRVDTQPEQSRKKSTTSDPISRKSQWKCAGESVTNLEQSEKFAQQAQGSSVTATKQDAAGHDES